MPIAPFLRSNSSTEILFKWSNKLAIGPLNKGRSHKAFVASINKCHPDERTELAHLKASSWSQTALKGCVNGDPIEEEVRLCF